MKPYFETANGKLYHGDCLEILPELEPVDLVVTSPPYGKLRTYNGYSFNFEQIANGLFSILVQNGVIVWVVGDTTINGGEDGISARQSLYFMSIGMNKHDTMIYEKNGPAYPSKDKYYQVFEYMFVFSKNGGPRVFNPLKDRKNKWYGQKWSNKRSRRNKDGELKEYTWTDPQGSQYGVRFNIWKYNVGAGYHTKDIEAFKHPAMFPEALAQDHIRSWSNPNDIVLDPMCGSGTTCKMAEILNRRWIGIEISEEYCEIAAKRIEREAKQLKLFR